MQIQTIASVVAPIVVPALSQHKAGLVEWTLGLWDKYIEPIDIPGVPDPAVDPLLRKLVEQGLDKGLDLLIAKLQSYEAAAEAV